MDDMVYRQSAMDEIKILLEQSEEDEHDKTWNCAIKSAINSVRYHTPSAQQWIPCSDRMPSMGERVVVSAVHHKTEDVVIDILRYHGKKYGWEFKDICTAVAWMPLPSPYREEANE